MTVRGIGDVDLFTKIKTGKGRRREGEIKTEKEREEIELQRHRFTSVFPQPSEGSEDGSEKTLIPQSSGCQVESIQVAAEAGHHHYLHPEPLS